jgi:hypothetical protein
MGFEKNSSEYSNIRALMKIALCISVSLADAKRAFLLVNNKKSKLLNCLGPPMLDALCLIASSEGSAYDFEYEEAVEFWHGKKDRRVSLFVKAKQAHSSVSNSRTKTPGDELDIDTLFVADDEQSAEWQI